MQLMDDPFAAMSQFGPMAGPGGFAGDTPGFGQQLPGMFGAQPRHHGGFNPLMFLSPLAGLMASHPKYGLAALSPAIGIANLLGAFK